MISIEFLNLLIIYFNEIFHLISHENLQQKMRLKFIMIQLQQVIRVDNLTGTFGLIGVANFQLIRKFF